MHVIFTPDGLPGWFGPEPVKGSVPLDMAGLSEGVDLAFFLAANRLVDGKWLPREPVKAHEPTAEELAEAANQEHQAALADREAAIDAAVLASDAYRQFLRGEMTLTAYRDAASDIAAGVPMPGR